MIPVAKPFLGKEEEEAVIRVLRSGMLASGLEVRAFEDEFASFIGTRTGVATNSGTSALHASLLATGIGPGDEVIVPDFTFVATASAVSMCGGTPVFVDIESETYGISPDSILEKISRKTKAIIAVHLFGHPCSIKAVSDICNDNSITLIEDCAQAHGAEYNGKRVGNFGDIATFSFYPTKNMTTGEGGMVVCDDKAIEEKIRVLINHGQIKRYVHENLGYNYRMTDLNAAIGREQLRKLSAMNDIRKKNAQYLTEKLSKTNLILPTIKNGFEHVFHQYIIRINNNISISRDQLSDLLLQKGINTAIHYPIPLHKQPMYQQNQCSFHCPVAVKVAQEVLSLPVHSCLTQKDLDIIISAVKEVVL